MNLRIAKKIVKNQQSRRHYPRRLLVPATRRILRWPHRKKIGPASMYSFHWIDQQGKVRPPPGDLYDACLLWEMSRFLYRTEFPDGTWVSTVFLGLDHSFGYGEPVWFETAICWRGQLEKTRMLNGEYSKIEILRRHRTREEARAYHETVAEAVRTKGTWVEPDDEQIAS